MSKNADGLHIPTEEQIEALDQHLAQDAGPGDYQPTPEQEAAYQARLRTAGQ